MISLEKRELDLERRVWTDKDDNELVLDFAEEYRLVRLKRFLEKRKSYYTEQVFKDVNNVVTAILRKRQAVKVKKRDRSDAAKEKEMMENFLKKNQIKSCEDSNNSFKEGHDYRASRNTISTRFNEKLVSAGVTDVDAVSRLSKVKPHDTKRYIGRKFVINDEAVEIVDIMYGPTTIYNKQMVYYIDTIGRRHAQAALTRLSNWKGNDSIKKIFVVLIVQNKRAIAPAVSVTEYTEMDAVAIAMDDVSFDTGVEVEDMSYRIQSITKCKG